MGENCWVTGCGSSRRKKGIYFHKLPCTPVDVEWQKQIESVIKTYREIDDALAARMRRGEIYTCERHFKSEDFYITPSGRKRLDINILPTLNLPVKSSETKKPPGRPTLVREPLPILIADDKCYSSLNDMNSKISNLKILPLTYRTCDNITYLELKITPYLIPKYIIKIDESLDFNLLVYNLMIISFIRCTEDRPEMYLFRRC